MTGREEFLAACSERADRWVPAAGGYETPTAYRNGKTLMLVFNPASRRHAYLDCDNDIVLTDAEARETVDRPTAERSA